MSSDVGKLIGLPIICDGFRKVYESLIVIPFSEAF